MTRLLLKKKSLQIQPQRSTRNSVEASSPAVMNTSEVWKFLFFKQDNREIFEMEKMSVFAQKIQLFKKFKVCKSTKTTYNLTIYIIFLKKGHNTMKMN